MPTAAVLWFMSQAVNQQRDVARQRLSEAYRSQLSLLRDQLDSYWERRAAALAKPPKQDEGPAIFQIDIAKGLADSVIYLGPSGAVAYPSPIALPANDPTEQRNEWSQARILENRHETLFAAAAAYGRIAANEKDVIAEGGAERQLSHPAGGVDVDEQHARGDESRGVAEDRQQRRGPDQQQERDSARVWQGSLCSGRRFARPYRGRR